MFENKLITGITSERGGKHAELFATSFRWRHTFPIESKSESHEAFYLMFQIDGVTPRMIFDGSKEQVGGDFARKCKEAGCCLKN